MSTKLALVSTLAGVLMVNGFALGATTQSIAKNTKKHDKKPIATATAESQRTEEQKKKDDEKKLTSDQLTKEKKKDGEKKQELVATDYQPALMKPASWRHFQQQHHRHYRSAQA
jgi:hypothetical protein